MRGLSRTLLIACIGGLILSFAGSAWANDPSAATNLEAMGVIQVGVILFTAIMGTLVSNRLGFSPFVGQLLAGMVVGPFLFSGAIPTWNGAILFQDSPFIEGLFWIGATLLMMEAGMSVSPSRFITCSMVGSCLGVLGLVFSFLLVTLGAWCVVRAGTAHVAVFSSVPLLVGAILAFTSHNQGLDVMKRANKGDSPEAETVRSSAMIVGGLGCVLWIGLLIALHGRVTGHSALAMGFEISGKILALGCVAVALFLVAGHRVTRLLTLFRNVETLAACLMSFLLFSLAFLMDLGPAMPMGAFILGLVVAPTELAGIVLSEIRRVQRFLMPIVLFVLGMFVDPSTAFLHGGLGVILWLVLVVVVCSTLGFGVPARMTHFNLRGAIRVTLALIPRGPGALVAAVAALEGGFISRSLYSQIIVTIFLSWLIGEAGLKLALINLKPGLRRPMNMDEGTEHLTFVMPRIELARMVLDKVFDVLTSEGFVASSSDLTHARGQFRKGACRVDCRLIGAEIDIECRHVDRPLLALALYEALARLLESLKDVDRSLDFHELGRSLQNGRTPGVVHIMPAVDVSADQLIPRLKGDSPQAIFQEMVEQLAVSGRVQDTALACRDLMRRNKTLSSGLQYGLAVCSVRTAAVKTAQWILGVTAQAVDFHSLDQSQTRVVLVWLTPQAQSATGLSTLSVLIRRLKPEVLTGLTQATSAVAMMGLIQHGTESAGNGHATASPGKAEVPSRGATELLDFLAPGMVQVNLQGTTKAEIISELLEMLYKSGRLKDVDAVREAVLSRENQMSTGMEHGVAVPHARTDDIDSFIAVVGIKRSGVDFASVDGAPSTIFVMSLARPDETATYVRFMAAVSRTLDAAGRARVLAAKTNDELWTALTVGPEAPAES